MSIKEKRKPHSRSHFDTVSVRNQTSVFRGFSSLPTHTYTHTHTHTLQELQNALTAFLGERFPSFKVCTDEKFFLVFLCFFPIVYTGFWPENAERSRCALCPLIHFSLSFYQHSKYLLFPPLWYFYYYYYLVWISTDSDETRECKCVSPSKGIASYKIMRLNSSRVNL